MHNRPLHRLSRTRLLRQADDLAANLTLFRTNIDLTTL